MQHLAVAGLSWDTIAALCQRDITLAEGRVVIGSQPPIELPATGLTTTCLVAVTRLAMSTWIGPGLAV
ncbi:hypothetical protein [Nocardia thailandica]